MTDDIKRDFRVALSYIDLASGDMEEYRNTIPKLGRNIEGLKTAISAINRIQDYVIKKEI